MNITLLKKISLSKISGCPAITNKSKIFIGMTHHNYSILSILIIGDRNFEYTEPPPGVLWKYIYQGGPADVSKFISYILSAFFFTEKDHRTGLWANKIMTIDIKKLQLIVAS